MNTISEIEQLEELELKGEIQGYKVISGMKEPLYRKHHLPTPNTGSFSGEYGNSFFYPVSIAAREKLKEYNKGCVMYSNGYPDFLPFTTQTTPWGIIQFSEEIGHMTESRVSRKVDGIVEEGNFIQAERVFCDKINRRNPDLKLTLTQFRSWYKRAKLTIHECADGKTVQLVPTAIHDACCHSGGVSEQKYRSAMGDICLDDKTN